MQDGERSGFWGGFAAGAVLGGLLGLFGGMAAVHETKRPEAYPKPPPAVATPPQTEKRIEVYEVPQPKPEKPIEIYDEPRSLGIKYGTDKEFKKKVMLHIDGKPYRLRIKLDGEPVLLPQQ